MKKKDHDQEKRRDGEMGREGRNARSECGRSSQSGGGMGGKEANRELFTNQERRRARSDELQEGRGPNIKTEGGSGG